MFVTKIHIPKHNNPIDYHDRILLLGSCFAENIGKKLIDSKFQISLNPFGILFNPESIAHAIELSIDAKQYNTSDIFHHQQLYHSFDFHTLYSRETPEETLITLNNQITTAQKAISQANTLIITFGSAFVYHTNSDHRVVANCHKMPDNTFHRKRLSVDQISDRWIKLLKRLPQIKQIIFSVSPVRHLRDGLHENQLSKSTLLLAIDQITHTDKRCSYFPAYEIVQDELRDYRYYDADMTHPSQVAVDYIWAKFIETTILESQHSIIKRCLQINNNLTHRPIAPQSNAYKQFVKHTIEDIHKITQTHPHLDFTEELKELTSRILELSK